MKTKLCLIIFLCVLFIINSCKKTDCYYIPGSSCDFIKASSTSLNDEPQEDPDAPLPLLPIVSKTYVPGSKKLNRIELSVQNLVYGGEYYVQLRKLNIYYKGNSTIFINEQSGDTAAVLNFNKFGQLTDATASPYLNFFKEEKFSFKFLYNFGRLKEIKSRVIKSASLTNLNWFSYAKLQYENAYQNISKLIFPSFESGDDKFITYTYNHSIRGKNQFYADEEAISEYYSFWYLLKYLNIFPELQPRNLLVKSYTTNPYYPGDKGSVFTAHQLDASGNLVKYKVTNTINNGYTPPAETWLINWQCGATSIKD